VHRSGTLLSRFPEPFAYALHPFLVHSGIDRLILPKSDTINVKTLDGLCFELDPKDEIAREILHFGAYEKRNVEIIKRLVTGPRGVFLDVGANFGNHTVFLADSFDRVVAFEPNPPTIKRLRRNLELNDLDHVSVLEFGLSDQDTELPFHGEVGTNPGASRFLENAPSATTFLSVRRGDGVVKEFALSPVRAIKVDVEGHEEQVIAGLADTIFFDRPLVIFEWDSARNGTGCFEKLADYHFFTQPWELSGGRAWRPFARGFDAARPPRLVPVRVENLAGRYVSMVVAIPEEKMEGVSDLL